MVWHLVIDAKKGDLDNHKSKIDTILRINTGF